MPCEVTGPTPFLGCCPNTARCCPLNFTSDPQYNGCTFSWYSAAYVRQLHSFNGYCPAGSVSLPNGDCQISVAPFRVNLIDYFGVGSCCRNIYDNSLQSSGCSQSGPAAGCPTPSPSTTQSHAQALWDAAAAALTSAAPFNTFVSRKFNASGQIVSGLVGQTTYYQPPIYIYASCNNPSTYIAYTNGAFIDVTGTVTYTKVYGQWAAVKWIATITNRANPGQICHNVTYTAVDCRQGQASQAGQLIRLEAPPSDLQLPSGLRVNTCLQLDAPTITETFWTVQKDATCSNLAP